jgi:tol-pal system protein YbgF
MKTERIFLFVFFASLLASGLYGCGASQQDVMTLNQRLHNVERQMSAQARNNRSLRLNNKKKEQTNRQQAAGSRAGIEGLKEQIRLLSGKFEENNHQARRQMKYLEASVQNLESRMKRIEKTLNIKTTRINQIEAYLDIEPKTASTAPKSQPKAISKKVLSEDEIYTAAIQFIDQENYEAARKKLKAFLKRHPKSTRTDNAQFWIAETYFREKWYEKALIEYQNVIERYPKGNKVPAAYLKQALAFEKIGDKANARLVLKELIKKFPKVNEAQIARQKLKK